MKEIEGHASALVPAPAEACFALLEAVGDYPTWSRGLVREVEVLEKDPAGRPTTARAVIYVAQSGFAREFEAVVGIRTEPSRGVYLTRVADESSDRERLEISWRLRAGTETAIDLEFRATVSVPRLFPLPRVGDSVAEQLLGDAVRALET